MDKEVNVPGRPILGWILGIGLLGALLYLLHRTVGWEELLRPWKSLPPVTVAGAFLLVLVSYGVRTVRIHQYFRPDTSGGFGRSYRLVLLHNLLNNLLPMRSGEASFPVLMKREFGVPVSRSLPGLLYLRLLDLHFLLFLAAAVLFAGDGVGGWVVPLILAPLPFLAFRFQEAVRDRMGSRAMVKRALAGLPHRTSLFWTTFLWTGLNWVVKLLVFAWLLQAFQPMPPGTALLGSVTGELSSVLPFHGLAGAGTYEAGVLAGLLPLGIEVDAALPAAVNLHLFVLGSSVLGAGVALVFPLGRRGFFGILSP